VASYAVNHRSIGCIPNSLWDAAIQTSDLCDRLQMSRADEHGLVVILDFQNFQKGFSIYVETILFTEHCSTNDSICISPLRANHDVRPGCRE